MMIKISLIGCLVFDLSGGLFFPWNTEPPRHTAEFVHVKILIGVNTWQELFPVRLYAFRFINTLTPAATCQNRYSVSSQPPQRHGKHNP